MEFIDPWRGGSKPYKLIDTLVIRLFYVGLFNEFVSNAAGLKIFYSTSIS